MKWPKEGQTMKWPKEGQTMKNFLNSSIFYVNVCYSKYLLATN
jgi:hypothetical protein